MATLGDILGAARRSAAGFECWIETSEPGLAEEVKQAVRETGQTPADFIYSTVADFSNFAGEEDWARLTRIIRDDPDPGVACLATMVRWRLDMLRRHQRHLHDGQSG